MNNEKLNTYLPTEMEKGGEKLKFGFPNKTIIIDSQSAPPLRGEVSEQVYKRMYLMGTSEDIVLHEEQYPIDSNYLNYLSGTLNLDLPNFVSVPSTNSGTLTGDILSNVDSIQYLKEKIAGDYKIQYFGLSDDLEYPLSQILGNGSYNANFEGVLNLGTKTGFREFCERHNLPMPKGKVCENMSDVVETVYNVNGNSLMLKARSGTAGEELGSNVEITKEEISQYAEDGELTDLLQVKINHLSPSDYPLVAEQKLPYKDEGSLHVFIDHEGNVIYEPHIIGQLAEKGSYKGGFMPNGLDKDLESKILKLANNKIVPALQSEGLTGFHCFDFMYDEKKQEFAFIEDNTRPGALDFINHMVARVIEANGLSEDYSFFSKNTSLDTLNLDSTSFEEIHDILGDHLDPNSAISKEMGVFALVSNPDTLPLGGDLILTVVSTTGGEEGTKKAEAVYNYLTGLIRG